MSRESFAPLLNVSKNTIVNYENEARVPDADFLNKLLDLDSEINPTWLLTGDGKMHKPQFDGRMGTKEPEPAWNQGENIGWDSKLMFQIIDEIEEALNELGEFILPAEKAKLYTRTYELCRREGSVIDREEIKRHLLLIV